MDSLTDYKTARFLGVEGGGTRTVALLADEAYRLLHRIELGPANLKLLTDGGLVELLRAIAGAFPVPDGLCIGLAGAWVDLDYRRIQAAADVVWPGTPNVATNDLETSLAAATLEGIPTSDRVLVTSGTGSGCYARSSQGALKIGGWGHVLGDRGSGYDVGLQSLRLVVDHYDREGSWPALGARILHHLLLNDPHSLIDWAQAAAKNDIASLRGLGRWSAI